MHRFGSHSSMDFVGHSENGRLFDWEISHQRSVVGEKPVNIVGARTCCWLKPFFFRSDQSALQKMCLKDGISLLPMNWRDKASGTELLHQNSKIASLLKCSSSVFHVHSWDRWKQNAPRWARKGPIKANFQMQEVMRRSPCTQWYFFWMGWMVTLWYNSVRLSFNCRYCLVVFKHPWARYIYIYIYNDDQKLSIWKSRFLRGKPT